MTPYDGFERYDEDIGILENVLSIETHLRGPKRGCKLGVDFHWEGLPLVLAYHSTIA